MENAKGNVYDVPWGSDRNGHPDIHRMHGLRRYNGNRASTADANGLDVRLDGQSYNHGESISILNAHDGNQIE